MSMGAGGMNPIGTVAMPEAKPADTPNLTNLENVAQTWGEFIPHHSGNVRVAGYQVWNGGYYTATTAPTVRSTDYKVPEQEVVDPGPETDLPEGSIGDLAGAGGILPMPSDRDAETGVDPNISGSDTSTAQKIYSNVAYSFGVNGVPAVGRIIEKIHADGMVIYDMAKPEETKFGFNVYMSGGAQDQLIRDDVGSDTPYYPDQILVVFQKMTFEGNTNSLPDQVDILLRANTLSGDELDVVTLEADRIVDGSPSDVRWEFPDWQARVLYVVKDGDEGVGCGKIYKYDLDTMEQIGEEVDIILSPGGVQDKWQWLIWFQETGVILGQQRSAGFSGSEPIWAINADSGTTIAKFGDYDLLPGEPEYILGCDVGFRMESGDLGGAIAMVNNPYWDTWRLSFVGSRQSGEISFQLSEMTGWDIAGLPNSWTNGSEGTAYMRRNGRIYALNGTQIEMVREFEAGDWSEYMFTYGEDLIMGVLNENQKPRILRMGSDGNIIYNEVTTDVPDNIDLDNVDNFPILNYPDLSAGTMVGSDGNYDAFQIDLETGKVTHFDRPSGGDVQWTKGQLWDSVNGRLLIPAPYMPDGELAQYVQFPYPILGGSVLLRDVIRSLYISTGKFRTEQILFEDIEDLVLGHLLVEHQDLSAVVENICRLWQIDRRTVDDTIIFYRQRPLDGVEDITATFFTEDLSPLTEQSADNLKLRTYTADDFSYATLIELSFIDPDKDYTANSVSFKRPDSPEGSSDTLSLSVPIVMTKNEALARLSLMVTEQESVAQRHELRLPMRHNFYGVNDVFRVTTEGFTFVMRVTEATLNGDHSLSIQAENIFLRPSPVRETPDTPRVIGGPTGQGRTSHLIFDVPPLRRSDAPDDPDQFIRYMMLYSSSDNWSGGYLARFKNSTNEWFSLFTAGSSSRPVIFRATNALTDKKWVTDEDPLEVESVCGNYDTDNNVNQAAIYANRVRNLALYGKPGRWEVVQFREIVGGEVRGIIRGLRGSEVFADQHEAGDLFVIAGPALVKNTVSEVRVGVTERFKSVTLGGRFASTRAIPHTPTGASLRPWAPYGIEAVRDTGSGDVDISWRRRDRLDGGWGVDTMSEATEDYEVDIYVGGSVVRTLGVPVDTRSVTYTSAQQITDGTDGDDVLNMAVYQLSAVVGRGFGERQNINVE